MEDKMQTLKDIKDVLVKIPDDTLEGLWFGLGEDAEDNISLVASETGSISKKQIGFPEVFDEYPKLIEIDKLVKNIIKAQGIMDNQDKAEELSEQLQEEGITDSFFEKDKKSSPNQNKSKEVKL